MQKKALIIGYGSLIRGDDAAGRRTVELLEQDPAVSEHCDLCSVHQLLPEHAGALQHYELVVFIDSSALDAPGEVCIMEIEPVEGRAPADFCNVHGIKPADILKSAVALYGAAPKACLCRIGGAGYDLTDSLSPEVENALVEAAARIRHLIFPDPGLKN